jgi:LysM repeat protein
MKDLRQVALGALLALGSMILVLGSILLAMAESQTYPMAAASVTLPPKYTLTPVAPAWTETPGGQATPATTIATQIFPPTPTLLPTSACPPPAGWVAYMVLPGDTLAGLAETYGVSEAELMAANCLEVSSLPAGYLIYVPQRAIVIDTNTPFPSPTICNAPYGWIIYTVRSGDYLTQIARDYGITYQKLRDVNCLTSDIIHPGDHLWVPNVPTITPAPSETGVPQPTLTPTPQPPTEVPTSTQPPSDTLTPTLIKTPTLAPTTVTIPTTAPAPSDTPSLTPTETVPAPTATPSLTPEPPTATLTSPPPTETSTVITPTAPPNK